MPDPLLEFLDFLKYEKNYAENTMVAYQRDVDSFQVFVVSEFEKTLLEVNTKIARTWVMNLIDNGVSASSVNRKISALKRFYKFSERREWVSSNPFAQIKAIKHNKPVAVPFSKQELDALDFDETMLEGNIEQLMILTMFLLGLRVSELVELKCEDIDLSSRVVKVRGKGGKERRIPMSDQAKTVLERVFVLRGTVSSDSLFVDEKSKSFSRFRVDRIVKRETQGITSKTKRHAHLLRHSFATELLNQGADIVSVKELMGHSSLAATQVYAHNDIHKLKKNFKEAHPRSIK